MSDTSYAVKAGEYFGWQREEMLEFVPATAHAILEVGCGQGGFAAYLKQQRRVHVTAVEAFPAAAAVAATRVDRLLNHGIDEALPLLADQRFDCIVLNDVLEHLVDPWSVLQRLRALLGPGGVVVASIPNMRYLPVLKDLVLRGQWRYQDQGVMDRTHLRFFTRRSMHEMFGAAGLTVRVARGLHPVQVSWKFELLDKLCRGALTDTRFQQFAFVAGVGDPP